MQTRYLHLVDGPRYMLSGSLGVSVTSAKRALHYLLHIFKQKYHSRCSMVTKWVLKWVLPLW